MESQKERCKAAKMRGRGESMLFCFGDTVGLGAEYIHLSLQIHFNTCGLSHCPP